MSYSFIALPKVNSIFIDEGKIIYFIDIKEFYMLKKFIFICCINNLSYYLSNFFLLIPILQFTFVKY